jgi:ClpP class serine protease
MYADFRDTVVAERSGAPNPLTISPGQLATGEIWTGIEGIEYGLVDQLGSKLDAIDRVVELTGLAKYDVVDIRDEYLASLEGSSYTSALKLYEALEEPQARFGMTPQDTRWPSVYSIYIPLE